MSKLITIPSSIDEINKTKDLVDGFIIGIKDYSINVNLLIDNLDYLNNIDKEIFVSLNRNYNNKEINNIKDILIKLNNYNIKGVLFYDIGVLNLYKKLDLNYDLIWNQEHLTTNYNTINYWKEKGVNYTYLSNDITKEEILNIKENTKSKLFINLFGYLPMFASKRHIVKNYLDYFNLNDNSKVNYIYKEDKTYPIIDNLDTVVYSNNIFNGIKLLSYDFDYVTLNSFNIELDKFIEVIKIFKENKKDSFNKINSMFENIDEGFLNTKTIYKVKKNEK